MSIQAPLSTKRLCMGHFAIFAEIFVGSYFGKGIDLDNLVIEAGESVTGKRHSVALPHL
ncbi:hypothetical protein [Nostoc sp.]